MENTRIKYLVMTSIEEYFAKSKIGKAEGGNGETALKAFWKRRIHHGI